MLTCPMVANSKIIKGTPKNFRDGSICKEGQCKNNQDLGNLGGFHHKGATCTLTKIHNSFLQGHGVVYNSPRNFCALYLKPIFSEVFIFKLQRRVFFPLIFISSSNCSTIAFQFPLPGTPLKQPSFRTHSKASHSPQGFRTTPGFLTGP